MAGRIRRIYRTIIAATMLVFVVAGIMQFHHHHSCEHAHSLCSYLLEEFGHCGHSHGDMPAHPDSPDSDCAMHLSDFQASGDDSDAGHAANADGGDSSDNCHRHCDMLPHAGCHRHTALTVLPRHDRDFRPGPRTCAGHTHSYALRGPPFC